MSSWPSTRPTRMYANVRKASSRFGVATRSPISGCSRSIFRTIPPIGSSTSGTQISSVLTAHRIGSCAPCAPCNLRGDRDPEHDGEPCPEGGGRHRRETDGERCTPADVAVAVLPPGAGRDRRQDREQRRGLGLELGQSERDERRDEQDPAADAEHAGQDACGEAQSDGDEDRRHETSSEIPIATRSSANAYESVRPLTRCCSDVPATAPAAAGSPTSAA